MPDRRFAAVVALEHFQMSSGRLRWPPAPAPAAAKASARFRPASGYSADSPGRDGSIRRPLRGRRAVCCVLAPAGPASRPRHCAAWPIADWIAAAFSKSATKQDVFQLAALQRLPAAGQQDLLRPWTSVGCRSEGSPLQHFAVDGGEDALPKVLEAVLSDARSRRLGQGAALRPRASGNAPEVAQPRRDGKGRIPGDRGNTRAARGCRVPGRSRRRRRRPQRREGRPCAGCWH